MLKPYFEYHSPIPILQCTDKQTRKTQVSFSNEAAIAETHFHFPDTGWSLRVRHAPVSCRCSSSGPAVLLRFSVPPVMVISVPLPALHCSFSLTWDWCRPICAGITLSLSAFYCISSSWGGGECRFCRRIIRATKFMRPKVSFGFRNPSGDFWSKAMRRMRNISIADYCLKAMTWAFQCDVRWCRIVGTDQVQGVFTDSMAMLSQTLVLKLYKNKSLKATKRLF